MLWGELSRLMLAQKIWDSVVLLDSQYAAMSEISADHPTQFRNDRTQMRNDMSEDKEHSERCMLSFNQEIMEKLIEYIDARINATSESAKQSSDGGLSESYAVYMLRKELFAISQLSRDECISYCNRCAEAYQSGYAAGERDAVDRINSDKLDTRAA